MATSRSTTLDRRDQALRLLADFDRGALTRWAEQEPLAVTVLQRLCFDGDELTRWRAVEALGLTAAVLARRGPEPVKEYLRRILWLMNDESGGLLWTGPEVMGAILANVPGERAEFGPIVASFLEEEPFRVGIRWALWRFADLAPEVVREAAPELERSFVDPDPVVRGLAALALRAAGAPVSDRSADLAPFAFFDHRTGTLRRATVAAAAAGLSD
jgi:hypothetical protein